VLTEKGEKLWYLWYIIYDGDLIILSDLKIWINL
jgi:stalled ribosome rescue protein Dom34